MPAMGKPARLMIGILVFGVCACNLLSGERSKEVETDVPQPTPTRAEQQPRAVEDTATAAPAASPVPAATPAAQQSQEKEEIAPPVESSSPTGLVDNLCPQLASPRGVFNLREMYRNPMDEDAIEFSLYQVREMGVDEDLPDFCTLFLAPLPLGELQFAGESLFWQSYDPEVEQAVIWQYDPADKLTDEVDPQHFPLAFTTLDVPSSFLGLTGFVVSDDGSSIAWSKTEPKLNEDNEYVYLQEIYVSDMEGSWVDPIWFDAAPEIDTPRIIRLRELSNETYTLYYSEEPVGLGAQWPDPPGRFTNLYSMPTWGEMPTKHYECELHWCISDFSEGHDLITVIQENNLQLLTMSGGTVADITLAGEFNVLRQALIGPEGDVVFLAVEYDFSEGEPERVALFHLAPPYAGEPELVAEDWGMRNILGWLSSDSVLVDSVFVLDTSETIGMFYIVDLAEGSVSHRPMEEYTFEVLLP